MTVPTSKPLSAAPPGSSDRCAPTLLLGLGARQQEQLGDVLRNDLVFSTASKWQLDVPNGVKLEILSSLDGAALVNMTVAHGGSRMVQESDLYSPHFTINSHVLEALRTEVFQAIVVDDSVILRETEVRDFLVEQYYQKGVSIVVLATEGVFNLTPLRSSFGVDWQVNAYTARSVQLTELGKRVLTEDTFPFEKQYTKATFVTGSCELFSEWIHPQDFLTDSEEEEEHNDNKESTKTLRPPNPGSPVVIHGEGDARISYFSFANPLDVSWGAIVLRLCYAAHHMDDSTARSIRTRVGGRNASGTDMYLASSALLPSPRMNWEMVVLVLVVAVLLGLYLVQVD